MRRIKKNTYLFGIRGSFVRSFDFRVHFLGIHSRNELETEPYRLYTRFPVNRWGGCDQVRREAERFATHSTTPTLLVRILVTPHPLCDNQLKISRWAARIEQIFFLLIIVVSRPYTILIIIVAVIIVIFLFPAIFLFYFR